jgi:hypothetical protein
MPAAAGSRVDEARPASEGSVGQRPPPAPAGGVDKRSPASSGDWGFTSGAPRSPAGEPVVRGDPQASRGEGERRMPALESADDPTAGEVSPAPAPAPEEGSNGGLAPTSAGVGDEARGGLPEGVAAGAEGGTGEDMAREGGRRMSRRSQVREWGVYEAPGPAPQLWEGRSTALSLRYLREYRATGKKSRLICW